MAWMASLVEASFAVLPKTSCFVSGLSWLSFSQRVSVSNLCGGVNLCFFSFISVVEDSILWPAWRC